MDTYEYSDIDDEFSYTKKDESITIICKLHLKFNDVSFNIISKELDLDIDAIRDIINLSINKTIPSDQLFEPDIGVNAKFSPSIIALSLENCMAPFISSAII